MFTGIVEEVGRIARVEPLADEASRLVIHGDVVLEGLAAGDSVCVSGVCLTAVDIDGGTFSADVMRETLRRSSLGTLGSGSEVNLERAVTLQTRLGGHLVQGHVDGVGTILSREHSENWDVVRVEVPRELSRYVVEKGSIAVDGVSLTVAAVSATQADGGQWLEVSLIPTTLRMTTLGTRQAGDQVNLEVDVLAKYVERLLGPGATA